MTKIDHINNSSDGTLRDSLGAIKHAQTKLRHLTRTCASPTVLASQIELCDVLLAEISGIHNNFSSIVRTFGSVPFSRVPGARKASAPGSTNGTVKTDCRQTHEARPQQTRPHGLPARYGSGRCLHCIHLANVIDLPFTIHSTGMRKPSIKSCGCGKGTNRDGESDRRGQSEQYESNPRSNARRSCPSPTFGVQSI